MLGAVHLPFEMADSYLDCALEDDERAHLQQLLTRRIIEVCIDRLALVANHRGLDFGITWPITRGLFERGDALFSFTGCHEIKPAPKIGVGAPTQEHCHEHKNPALFQTIIQSDLHRGEP